MLIGCARFNCEISVSACTGRNLKPRRCDCETHTGTHAVWLRHDDEPRSNRERTQRHWHRGEKRDKESKRQEKMRNGKGERGEKWWIGIRVKETPREWEIWNWKSSRGDHLPKRLIPAVCLPHRLWNWTRFGLWILVIFSTCFYLIIFHRLSVDGSKMIWLIILCWSCTQSNALLETSETRTLKNDTVVPADSKLHEICLGFLCQIQEI